jgi:hypothetical protein
MKIVSCYISQAEIGPLVRAGADELYTSVSGLPSFTCEGLGDRSGLPAAFREIHSLGKKALVALNSMYVIRSAAGMRKLADAVFRMEAEGADAFIISSPSLLSLLRSGRRRLKAGLHLSSVQPCFNTGTLRFFLRFGITRLILPSQLAPLEAKEILRLCREEGVETEIFDYRFFGCAYVNGRCNMHIPRFHTFSKDMQEGSLCRCGDASFVLPARPFNILPARAAEAPALARRVGVRMGGGGAPRLYNAASFYDFFRLGVGWLKYGVRLDPPEAKARKVRALKEMAGLAGRLTKELGPAAARKEFIRRMTAWRDE